MIDRIITKFRLWLALKVLGCPDYYPRDEAIRLYDKMWPKHSDTKNDNIRTICLFMMRERINERFECCRRKRFRI